MFFMRGVSDILVLYVRIIMACQLLFSNLNTFNTVCFGDLIITQANIIKDLYQGF